MTDSPSDAELLGAEIREVRKARGLTLNVLSTKVGCSVAYLSRIERGTTNLSVELLTGIGTALDVDPRWFFPTREGEGQLERRHIVRKANRRPLSGMYTRKLEELGFEDELLSSTLSGDCYMLLSRFPPGKGERPSHQEGYVFEGEQHGFILSGEITLALGEEMIALKPGDSFSYPSEIPHRFHNNSTEESIMIWAMSPVRISW